MANSNNKIDPALIVNNSTIRAAIPILPLPVAMMCFVFNVFIPGSGKQCSGYLALQQIYVYILPIEYIHNVEYEKLLF